METLSRHSYVMAAQGRVTRFPSTAESSKVDRHETSDCGDIRTLASPHALLATQIHREQARQARERQCCPWDLGGRAFDGGGTHC